MREQRTAGLTISCPRRFSFSYLSVLIVVWEDKYSKKCWICKRKAKNPSPHSLNGEARRLSHTIGMVEPVGVIEWIVELAGLVIAVDKTFHRLPPCFCQRFFLFSQHTFLCFLVGLHICNLFVCDSICKGTGALVIWDGGDLFSEEVVMTTASFCDK